MLRIAIISPYSTGPMRGNITTVRRIIRHLTTSGVEILELPADVMSTEEMLIKLHSFAPDIIHAFHAYHCGPIACQIASKLNKPLVITITGSDINEPEFCSAPSTRSAITAANAIVCFDIKAAQKISSNFPDFSGKLQIIPQGVESFPISDNNSFHIPSDSFVMLLPAALRPVKQIEFAISVTAQLTGQINNLLLLIVGGAIDTKYSADICKILRTAPHALWLGEIPQEKMSCLYKRADIVLNCSTYEEMPNSLLEAMALGRAVLAADIDGNRSLIIDGQTGLLYNGKEDFKNKTVLLSKSSELQMKLGEQARQYVLSGFSPQTETEAYIKLYKSIVMTF